MASTFLSLVHVFSVVASLNWVGGILSLPAKASPQRGVIMVAWPAWAPALLAPVWADYSLGMVVVLILVTVCAGATSSAAALQPDLNKPFATAVVIGPMLVHTAFATTAAVLYTTSAAYFVSAALVPLPFWVYICLQTLAR